MRPCDVGKVPTPNNTTPRRLSVHRQFDLSGRIALVTGSSKGIGFALARANIDSVFLVGRAVAQRMIQRQRGKIIKVCSVQSELGRPGIAPYAATKGAVKMLTKGMAIDLGKYGIQVNGLGPAYFKTELTQALVADEAFTAWLSGCTPAGRWGHVEEIGGAAVFLASDASSFVNGHILYVDGGITASL